MNRIVMAALIGLSTTAGASASEAMVANHSGLPIDELSVSAPGQKAWGPNLLDGVAEGALDDGKSLTVAGLKEGTWDFKIDAPDEGISCVIPNVTVGKGGAVDLTPDLGKACK